MVAVVGTPADGCDITPHLRSGFQTHQERSKKSGREVEWRRGGMVSQGHVVEQGLEPEVNQEMQGAASRSRSQGRAKEHQGGAEDHHSKSDRPEDPHGGADDQQGEADGAENRMGSVADL